MRAAGPDGNTPNTSAGFSSPWPVGSGALVIHNGGRGPDSSARRWNRRKPERSLWRGGCDVSGRHGRAHGVQGRLGPEPDGGFKLGPRREHAREVAAFQVMVFVNDSAARLLLFVL